MSGRPTREQAAKFHDRTDNEMNVLKPASRGGPMKPPREAKYPTYPDYYYPDDKEKDTFYNEKLKATTELNARDVPSEFQVTDDFIRYRLGKKDAKELANFKLFVETAIPRGSPWAREFFEKIMPGWYQSKIDIVHEKVEIIKRFMDMSIKGVQSIEDMMLLWMVYHGKIELPANIPDILTGGATQTQAVNLFGAGLFNPSRWVDEGPQKRLAERNRRQLANIAINGIDLKELANNAAIATEDTAYADIDPANIAHNGFFNRATFWNRLNEGVVPP